MGGHMYREEDQVLHGRVLALPVLAQIIESRRLQITALKTKVRHQVDQSAFIYEMTRRVHVQPPM